VVSLPLFLSFCGYFNSSLRIFANLAPANAIRFSACLRTARAGGSQRLNLIARHLDDH
jgi:hypothetical protein